MAETETETIPTKRSSRRRAAAPSAPAPAVPVPEAEATPSPTIAPTIVLREPAPAPMPPPSSLPPEPTLANSPFRKHDVVQVTDKESRHFGQFFIVGGVQNRKVHGYYMSAGLHKEYVTIELQHCWHIGLAKIRSAQPCSPKWLSDNKGT